MRTLDLCMEYDPKFLYVRHIVMTSADCQIAKEAPHSYERDAQVLKQGNFSIRHVQLWRKLPVKSLQHKWEAPGWAAVTLSVKITLWPGPVRSLWTLQKQGQLERRDPEGQPHGP